MRDSAPPPRDLLPPRWTGVEAMRALQLLCEVIDLIHAVHDAQIATMLRDDDNDQLWLFEPQHAPSLD